VGHDWIVPDTSRAADKQLSGSNGNTGMMEEWGEVNQTFQAMLDFRHHSIIPSFHHSIIPSFHHSIIPSFHHLLSLMLHYE
jgi:hypothetical protein